MYTDPQIILRMLKSNLLISIDDEISRDNKITKTYLMF